MLTQITPNDVGGLVGLVIVAGNLWMAAGWRVRRARIWLNKLTPNVDQVSMNARRSRADQARMNLESKA